MRTRWFTLSIRVIFGLVALLAGAFMSFGAALADERKPEPQVQQVADEAVDATAPIHVAATDAQGQPCTFDALFAVMSHNSIRATFTNVAGACDGVRATGEVTTAGNPPIVVDEQVREAPYPGIKLGYFPNLPYDTATVTFRLTLGTMALPPITLQHKRGPVHVWLNFPQWPNKCLVNGPFKNDPGILISDNGHELKRAWFSAASGEWGPLTLTGNGTHNLTIETYRPRGGKPQWEEQNQVLNASFEADCEPSVPAPVFEAKHSVYCDQNWSFEIVKQENVASVRWFVDGQPVEAPSGNLGAAPAIEVLARVVGTDGKSYEYRYAVNRNTDPSCNTVDPEFSFQVSIDCKQDWQAKITQQKNVVSVEWFVDGQPVAEAKGNLGDAQSAAVKAHVTFKDIGSKDYDYTVERQAPCPTPEMIFRAAPKADCENFEVTVVEQRGVVSVAWMVNNQPIAQPKGKLAAAQTISVHADVKFVDGSIAGYDYVIEAPTDCSSPSFHATRTIDCNQSWAIAIDKQQGVASVEWSANGQPIAQLKGNLGKEKSLVIRAHILYVNGQSETIDYPFEHQQDCPSTSVRLASSNQVECAQLPGSDQQGLIKYKTFDNVANMGEKGDWRLMHGEFSLDGTTWTRFDSKRFGFDPRAGDIRNPQWVNWTVGLYVDGVFSGKTSTVRDSLPGFDAARENTWRTFDYPIDWISSRFLQAGKPAAIDAIRTSIAACTPPPPPTPITICVQGPNGPEQATFADGKIPAGVTALERCEATHQLTELTVCTGWDVAGHRAIFRAFAVKEEYDRAVQEASNRCRPPEATGTARRSQAPHAHLRVRGVDADVAWLEQQGNFATNQAAQHRWNSKRIISLHYFGKGRGLAQVQTGDVISWTDGGNVVTYRVKEIKVVAYNGAEYGAPESLVPDDGIMLMTCYQPKSATAIIQTLMIIGERVS